MSTAIPASAMGSETAARGSFFFWLSVLLATIVERFTPSVDGAKLDYEIVVTDPVTFTEPVRMEKFWLSIPGQAFDAYNCGAPLSP